MLSFVILFFGRYVNKDQAFKAEAEAEDLAINAKNFSLQPSRSTGWSKKVSPRYSVHSPHQIIADLKNSFTVTISREFVIYIYVYHGAYFFGPVCTLGV